VGQLSPLADEFVASLFPASAAFVEALGVPASATPAAVRFASQVPDPMQSTPSAPVPAAH